MARPQLTHPLVYLLGHTFHFMWAGVNQLTTYNGFLKKIKGSQSREYHPLGQFSQIWLPARYENLKT
jgi:hypothetical protein